MDRHPVVHEVDPGDLAVTMRDVYESYGFEPLETPAVENIETLMLEQCVPNAPASNTYRPSRIGARSGTSCSTMNGWMGVTSDSPQ